MNLLNAVKSGAIQRNDFIVLYGIEGVGKSTFAADAPKPIFIDLEKGTFNLDVSRVTPPDVGSFDEIMSFLKELQSTDHDYKTLALDSLDHFEPLVWSAVCKEHNATSISDQEKLGYGRGYVEAANKFLEFLNACEALREKMNIILIAHSEIKTIHDPMKMEPYDKFEIKLNKKASALVKEKAEAVLFATSEVLIKKVKGAKAKALGEGKRVLYTQGMPGHEGKNRYNLPYQIDLSWQAYQEAKKSFDPEDTEALKESVRQLLSQLTDAELKSKATEAFEKAGNDHVKIEKILNRLQVKMGV